MASSVTDRESQLGYFREVEADHYRWQTDGGYFAETERELLLTAALPATGRLLEIGCGEGGNLFHLGARPGWVGVDFAHHKLAHAQGQLSGVSFACCDAAALPFRDESFDSVLIRDVLHHVPDRRRVVAAAAAVLKPGGTLVIIEPNRNSPLILAQAVAVRAERAVLRSTATRLRSELREVALDDIHVERAQPLPLARVVLHPRLGVASLGRSKLLARWLRATDSLARRFVAPSVWMYLVGRGRKARR